MPSEPSEEMIAVLSEFDQALDRKARFAALDKMWLLEDPEIIELLLVVYNENNDKKTREKAGEILGKYKGLYNALRTPPQASGGGRAGLRNILVITLLLLVGANGALFFMSATDGDEDTPRNVQAERAALVDKIEADMRQSIALSQNLRDTAQGVIDGENTLETACATTFEALPDPVELSGDQPDLFPDIQSVVTNENSYVLVFDYVAANFGAWRGGCQVNPPAVDTVGISRIANDTISVANSIIDNELVQLRTNPYNTPTPVPLPTNTPTNTPEPTATPFPREQSELIAQLYQQVERAEFNAAALIEIIDQMILSGGDRSEFCREGSIWGMDSVRQITLTGDEIASFPEINAYLADPNNPLSTLIAENLVIIEERNALCRDNSSDSVRLGILRRQAETMGTTIRGVETSLLDTVGPNPN